MSKSGQRPSKADVGGQRPPKAPKQKPAAKQNASGEGSKRQRPLNKQP